MNNPELPPTTDTIILGRAAGHCDKGTSDSSFELHTTPDGTVLQICPAHPLASGGRKHEGLTLEGVSKNTPKEMAQRACSSGCWGATILG